MINLEIPESIRKAEEMARMLADGVFRPISRKYDKHEHEYPKELDAWARKLAALAPLAVRAMLEIIDRTADGPLDEASALHEPLLPTLFALFSV